jgi:hypothetical protein
MTKKRETRKPRLERVSVRGELRNPVDWDRFAWALLQHAKVVMAQEAKQLKGKQAP